MSVAVATLVLAACGTTEDRRAADDVIQNETRAAFYEVPADAGDGEPGELIKSERLIGAPDGATAWRVMYHSRDALGGANVVSGVVVTPNGPPLEGAGRPVVSWGHPTTGAAPRCAPSDGIDPFVLIEGLKGLLDAGYTVAATDYPGMGVEGASSYLIGGSEGHSVLDAARAARQIPEAHAGTDLLLWGHSQGGQAALFAAQEVSEYAPELSLKGVAVAAPAAELTELLSADIGDLAGVSIGSYALSAFQDFYGPTTPGLELSAIVTPEAEASIPKMAELCLLGQNKELHALAEPLIGKFLTADLASTAPWSTLLAENTPGAAPIGVPVLVAQGEADKLVVPTTTDSYVQKICSAGEHVEYRRYPGIDHGLVAERALPLVDPWFAAVLAGEPVPTTCPTG